MKIFVCALLSTVIAAVACQALGLPPLLGHLHADGFIIFVAAYVISAGVWDAAASHLNMRKALRLEVLIEQAKRITPTPPTHAQRLDFAYGNLAMSTRHRPDREAFRKVAFGIGMSEDDFIAWARGKEWK